MNESGERLTRTATYNDLFRSLERLSEASELSPSAAYEMFVAHSKANGLDPLVYLSSSVTSGGFARDESLSFSEVLDANSRYGTKVKGVLLAHFDQLDDSQVVLPSELGKVYGWGQSDYLLFWFHVIAGVSAQDAVEIEAELENERGLAGFYDKTLGEDVRWSHYAQFTQGYIDAIARRIELWGTDFAPQNIASMVPILDPARSLGVRAEKMLCLNLGIPVEYPVISPEHYITHSTTADSVRLHGLGSLALTITSLPRLPHAFEDVIMHYDVPHYQTAEAGGFRPTGLCQVALK